MIFKEYAQNGVSSAPPILVEWITLHGGTAVTLCASKYASEGGCLGYYMSEVWRR